MLKEVVASKAAKLIAACVCPVAGTAALTVSVPEVREAVHRATAPRAHAKPQAKARPARAAAAVICPQLPDTPVVLGGGSIAPELSGVTLLPPLPLELASAPRSAAGGGGLLPRRFIPDTPFASPGAEDVVIPPGPIPEPHVWLQLLLGFTVVGGATRVTYRQQRRGADGPDKA